MGKGASSEQVVREVHEYTWRRSGAPTGAAGNIFGLIHGLAACHEATFPCSQHVLPRPVRSPRALEWARQDKRSYASGRRKLSS